MNESAKKRTRLLAAHRPVRSAHPRRRTRHGKKLSSVVPVVFQFQTGTGYGISASRAVGATPGAAKKKVTQSHEATKFPSLRGFAASCENTTDYVSETGEVVASYSYDAFGRTLSATGPMADAFPFRFSTKYYDSETGLYYYGRRYYSPDLGRWLNPDPIEEEGQTFRKSDRRIPMKIGTFDRKVVFLILGALALILSALTDWIPFESLIIGKRRSGVSKRKALESILELATIVTINPDGLLEDERRGAGRDRLFYDGFNGTQLMAYSPSGNSYRLAVIPKHLSGLECGQEWQLPCVLQVSVQSNRISRIEIVHDPERCFSYDLIANGLRFYGYSVQVATNDGERAFICTKR